MRKLCSAVLAWVLITSLLVGCSGDKPPKGVRTNSDGQSYYSIMLPTGRSIKDYFDVSDPVESIATSATVTGHDPHRIEVVHIYRIEGEGWIAILSDDSGLFFYFPEGIAYKDITRIASLIILGTEDYMSIEEAKTYIPSLR